MPSCNKYVTCCFYKEFQYSDYINYARKNTDLGFYSKTLNGGYPHRRPVNLPQDTIRLKLIQGITSVLFFFLKAD